MPRTWFSKPLKKKGMFSRPDC